MCLHCLCWCQRINSGETILLSFTDWLLCSVSSGCSLMFLLLRYVSCVMGCPWEGKVSNSVVVDLTRRLLGSGNYVFHLCHYECTSTCLYCYYGCRNVYMHTVAFYQNLLRIWSRSKRCVPPADDATQYF
eukprot:GHVQ01035861.1.p3 GENE.GHVQ01035861.1~~GHVQ01035861.1.p3  ORF type:complete len:130 (+),score=7.61 GHVQ01035861.1:785-1174(+)